MKTNQSQKNIPKGWKIHKLGSLVDIINGKTPLRSRDEFWMDGNIPWFTIEDIRSGGRFIKNTNQSITKIGLEKSGIKIIPENSTLICCTASVGEYALTKIPLTTNQQFNALVVKDKKIINPIFLYFVAQTFTYKLKKIMGSTTFGFVNVGALSDFKIEIPSNIKEQEKIAEILEMVELDIDTIERVIKETDKLKKGLAKELLIKGIGHKKFKKTKLGEIPENWKIVKLGDIGTNIIGLTYSPKNVVGDSGTLVFRSSNVKNGHIVYGDNVYVNSKIPENLITKKGDILLCTRNGSRNLIGKCAFIDNDSAGHSFGAFMSVYRTEHSEFIFQLFLSDIFKDQIKRYLGATINQITNASLNSFITPLPPQEEQDKICKILLALDEKITVNKQLKEKLTQLKKGLMSDLLSGKVRV